MKESNKVIVITSASHFLMLFTRIVWLLIDKVMWASSHDKLKGCIKTQDGAHISFLHQRQCFYNICNQMTLVLECLLLCSFLGGDSVSTVLQLKVVL